MRKSMMAAVLVIIYRYPAISVLYPSARQMQAMPAAISRRLTKSMRNPLETRPWNGVF